MQGEPAIPRCTWLPAWIWHARDSHTDPRLQQPTGGPVVEDDSMWMLGDDGEIEVNLQKMKKGDTWECALLGHGQV